MKNINKNAICALASYSDSYLVHHNFPGFALDGSVPFTVEVSFAYQDSNHGSFYCQEDGMDLGLREGRPYFTHPALGELYAPKGFELERSFCHLVAVVFDGSTLKMYIHGFEIASQDAVKKTAASSKGFCIGKGFHGWIRGVRVLSKAMTAAEIMRDQGEDFQEDAACEFWTDFSTVAYKDISKNRMELWRTGHDAHCANVVNCTVLDRNGLYARTNPVDYQNAFSVTGKLYPDFSRKGNFYIYSLYSDDGPYIQLYLAQKEDGYYLAADVCGQQLVSGTRVQGLRWTDYALTADIGGGNVCLYQDGAKCAEQVFAGLGPFTKAKAVIGGKYFKTRPEYGDAFAGLLDYCAEFSCVLSGEAVDAYAEDQPYVYADNITALLLFGWGEPEDLYMDAPLVEYGGGYYSMEADTSPVTAPVGLNWYLPDNDEEYWNSLSEYEQWEVIQLYTLVGEIIEGLTGIPMKARGNKALPDGGTPKRRIGMGADVPYHRKPGIGYERFSPPSSPEYSPVNRFTERVAINVRPPMFPMANQNAGGGCVAAFLAGIQAFFQSHWKELLAVAAGIAVVYIVNKIIKSIEKGNKDRPENKKAQLRVKSVQWNHGGNPENGSIHFHDSAKDPMSPKAMAFVPEGSCIKATGVFIPSKLKKVLVDLMVENSGTKDYSGSIILKDTAGKQVAKSSSVNIAKDACVQVGLTVDAGEIRKSGMTKKSDRYDIYCTGDAEGTFLVRCEYTYYTLLGEPISPWNNTQGEYTPSNLGYVSIPLLEICVDKFPLKQKQGILADREQLVQAVISGMNSCGKLTYDKNGAPYFSTVYLGFKYIKFIKAMEKDGDSPLNCADCATIVSSICAMHGADYPMTILGVPFGRTAQSYFRCNQIQPITSGTPEWGYPFDWEKSRGYGGFSFHMVNRSNEPGISGSTKIYDACLKVDAGDYPGKPHPGNSAKNAKQPLGMAAYGSESAFVNVPDSAVYTADVYRERLVFHGAEACFCSAPYRVLGIDSSVENRAMRRGMDMESSQFDIEAVFKNNSHVTAWEVLDDTYDEKEWSLKYDDKPIEICRYIAGEQEDHRKAVGRVMALFTNPDIEDISDCYPGSCCYKVTDSCYVIWKDGNVYRIIGAYAKEAADCIYKT